MACLLRPADRAACRAPAAHLLRACHAVAVKMLQMKCPTCEVTEVPNSGPAPVLARFEDFKVCLGSEGGRQGVRAVRHKWQGSSEAHG